MIARARGEKEHVLSVPEGQMANPEAPPAWLLASWSVATVVRGDILASVNRSPLLSDLSGTTSRPLCTVDPFIGLYDPVACWTPCLYLGP